MKAKKVIKRAIDMDIHITGMTLLSFDEYRCFHPGTSDYPSCYEESDIKKFLDQWAEDNGLVFD